MKSVLMIMLICLVSITSHGVSNKVTYANFASSIDEFADGTCTDIATALSDRIHWLKKASSPQNLNPRYSSEYKTLINNLEQESQLIAQTIYMMKHNASFSADLFQYDEWLKMSATERRKTGQSRIALMALIPLIKVEANLMDMADHLSSMNKFEAQFTQVVLRDIIESDDKQALDNIFSDEYYAQYSTFRSSGGKIFIEITQLKKKHDALTAKMFRGLYSDLE